MQRERIIKRSLRKQGVKFKDRRMIIRVYENEYDQFVQYADAWGKTPVNANYLQYEILLLQPLKEIGFELKTIDGQRFMVKIS